jgi:hypothetical protein
MTVYRVAAEDPVKDPSQATVRWRDSGRPESQLFGGMYSCLGYWGDGKITAAGAWPFRDLPASARNRDGTVDLPGIVGQEIDRYFPGLGPADTAGVQVLAHSDFLCTAHADSRDAWDMTYYTTKDSHAGVLAVGTMVWVCNLDSSCVGHRSYPVTAPRVRAITKTALEVFAQGPAGLTHPSVPSTASTGAPPIIAPVHGAGDGFDSWAVDTDDD